MDIVEKLKQNENTPIYLAFTLGILTGTIIGFLVSPIKAGVTIGSNNNIENHEEGKPIPEKEPKKALPSPKTQPHYQAPPPLVAIRASAKDFFGA